MAKKWKRPVAFLLVGMGFKAALVILYRYFPHPAIIFLASTCDPAGLWIAERAAGLFFETRGIAPEVMGYVEYFWVPAFGAECFLLGIAINCLRASKD